MTDRAEAELAYDRERAQRFDNVDWVGLLRRRNGRIIGDEANVLQALRSAPDLFGLVRFNEFAQQVEFARCPPWHTTMPVAWTDDDDVNLQAWLQVRGVDVRQRGVVADCVATVAKDRTVHPVREYLLGLQWDGRARLTHWLIDYLDAHGPAAYLETVGRRFLVQAVARILAPGCQADYTLVLEGVQGGGKSRTARALAVRPDWFTDSMPNLHDKDAAIQLCGRWIVELAELAAIRRTADVEGVKAFLTRPVDVYRPPYARRAVPVPRSVVFIATTNQTQYLRDATGNRRFWPVRCGRIDLEALERDRDQLWAEAVSVYRSGEAWHLNAEETTHAAAEQDERRLVTELEGQVIEYLARLTSQQIHEVDMRTVLREACGLDASAADYVERAGRLGPLVAEAMNLVGWQKARATGRAARRRNLYVYNPSQGLTG
jgi:predicted P-loop ATPase